MNDAVAVIDLPDADFDEALYLSRYPDIARAVAAGGCASGWAHYREHGRAEGRSSSLFDEVFYLRSYPIAVREIAAGLARNAADHYRLLGKARGFLPTRAGDRPTNAARMPAFGGCWIDAPDAADRIAGRLETGRITAAEATQLKFWLARGYVIIPGAVTHAMADRGARDLDRAFAGELPNLLFECGALARGHLSWRPEMNAHPAKALDLHCFSAPMRSLMFAPAITAFLSLIFESNVLASQSLTFLRGSAQDPHQDSAYVAYTIPRQFAASWIALEDVTIGAGELFYYDRSHRFPDFRYSGKFKSVSEAERNGAGPDLQNEITEHVRSLKQLAEQRKLPKAVFKAKKGDALIWHADLVHGGNPISSGVTRKSLVTHYCPKRLSPVFLERCASWLGEHEGHYYTTSLTSYAAPPGK